MIEGLPLRHIPILTDMKKASELITRFGNADYAPGIFSDSTKLFAGEARTLFNYSEKLVLMGSPFGKGFNRPLAGKLGGSNRRHTHTPIIEKNDQCQRKGETFRKDDNLLVF